MHVRPDRRSVIVGVDGSPNSIAALRRAAAEAERRHAQLKVVRVLAPPAGRGRPAWRVAAEWLRLRELVAHTIPVSQHRTTRLRVLEGEPAMTLVGASAHSELLVIGARVRSDGGSPLGGGTVPGVLRDSPCEVIVCADHGVSAQEPLAAEL
ncbi:universal stress protein [Spirillospora sp. NPDC048911]|uniref:universal stress protein n=1 Tax=Spirillospora sp. NPDC048911 TaxID=3364527 RepID=UPI003718CD20